MSKTVGSFLYAVLWLYGFVVTKGFWMSVAAFIIPLVGPYEAVRHLAGHFGLL